LLTLANHILGSGQLSLAKFLFITADDSNQLYSQDVAAYLTFLLQRINLTRDIHFYTNTTIDTLDYSGTGLNSGSKVVLAAYGDIIRELASEVPPALKELNAFINPKICLPGIVALQTGRFETYEEAAKEMEMLNAQLVGKNDLLNSVPIIVICDDAGFTAATLRNFLWVTFTRCNPSHDMYGIDAFTKFKHWGCNGSLIIDARIKPHHAPPVETDPAIERKIDRLFAKSGSLHGIG
jgi:4-hydroxy-3-polyprenylbenzoate decarboxylase